MLALQFICLPSATRREKSLQISQYKFCTLTFIRPGAVPPPVPSNCHPLAFVWRLLPDCQILQRRRRQDLLRQLHIKLTQLCTQSHSPPSPSHSLPPPLCSGSNCLLLHSFLRRVCMKIWSIICATKARTTNERANGRMGEGANGRVGPRPIHQSCLPCSLFLLLLLLH